MNALKTKAAVCLALFAGLGGLFAMPAAGEASEKSSVNAAAAIAPLTVSNRTGSSLRVYVDNQYRLYVPAFSSRTVYVTQDLHVYRALTRDGRTVGRVHFMKSGGAVWTIRVR